MGQRTKGGMWCKVDGPVLGVKNTHRVRNAAAVVVPGAFLFAKVEGYFCPKCGATVHPAWTMAGAASTTSEGAPHEAMVTPDRKWISLDGGEHYQSTATSPPPPAPTIP